MAGVCVTAGGLFHVAGVRKYSVSASLSVFANAVKWRGIDFVYFISYFLGFMMKPIPLFHLAFPVNDIAEARRFYGELLGCEEGRSSDAWVDFNFYGHQIVAHLAPDETGHKSTSEVDGDQVPVRHFGAILDRADWDALAEKLKRAGIKFIIEPHVRFKGEVGEQATMFFLDPSGNALEFKSFAHLSQVFAK
jgi:extradiol dioxygenase family protein